VKIFKNNFFATKCTKSIIFWLARQEKAVVLGSCNMPIYIDL
jgi:hypothetical protein